MIKVFIYNNEFYINKNGKDIDIPLKISKNDIESEIRNFVLKIENQKVNGIKIHEMYTYEGIELYNFCRGSIYDKVKELLNKFSLIENIINYFGDTIEINTDDLVYKYLAENVFFVNCNYKNNSIVKSNRIKNKYKKIQRLILGFNNLIKVKIKNKKNTLFLTQANSINSIIVNNNKIIYDSQFGKVLDKMKKEDNIFKIQYLNNDSLIDRSLLLGKDIFPFENFIFMKKFIYKLNIQENKINDKLIYIRDLDFYFHEKNLYEFINEFLLKDLKCIMNNYIYEIYAAEKLMKFININKVIVIDEADRIRCFIYAANKNNIPSFAIQHGIITLGSSAYFIPSKDEKYVPYKTFVWGEEFKKTLIYNSNVYNENNVEVVGQLRTDYLFEKLKYNNISNDNTTIKILYATQSIEDLTYEATEILFKSLQKMNKKYSLVIKLHPNDTYEKIYNDLIKKYNIKNVEITRDMDIYDAIIWSDVVISVHSTVNLEAAILNKSSICILLNKYWDEGNFVKDDISLGAKNYEELRMFLENIDKYKLNNENTIKRYFHKIDGCVSERIINTIDKIN